MKILFLGPECKRIERYLARYHAVTRRDDDFSTEWIQRNGFEFCVSYRFKKIISPEVISLFPLKIINLHISLLPWNRGYDPNIWSFLENTPKGVSIHRIDEGIDTGPVLLQQSLEFDDCVETLESSWNKLSIAVENLFIRNSEVLISGAVPAIRRKEKGSFHLSTDKHKYEHLWQQQGYKTIVRELVGKAL